MLAIRLRTLETSSCFLRGTLDLWVQNELTEAQFRAQIKHGCILRLLALGHGKSREYLLKQLWRCRAVSTSSLAPNSNKFYSEQGCVVFCVLSPTPHPWYRRCTGILPKSTRLERPSCAHRLGNAAVGIPKHTSKTSASSHLLTGILLGVSRDIGIQKHWNSRRFCVVSAPSRP
jgi:hypothetical protein